MILRGEMMKVKVKKAIYHFGRIEPNTVIDLPDDVVKAFGDEYLEVLEKPKEVANDVSDAGRSETVSRNKRDRARRKT